jgi:hypothetical protein
MNNMSNVDKKKYEKEKYAKPEDKAANPDNWLSFLKSIIISLVYVLILGTLGSNFTYLITETNLNVSLPGSLNNLPYNPPGARVPKFGAMKGGDGTKFLNTLYPTGQLWFPYSFPYESLEEGTFLFEFSSIFTQSIAFAFANGRNLLSKMLHFFKDLNSQTPYLFYLYPIIVLLLTIVPVIPIIGLILGIVGGFNTELPYALIWLVLCLLTIGIQWASVIGLLLLLSFVGYTFFNPLMQNGGVAYLKNKLREYQHGLLIIWSIFVLMSAFSKLGNVVGSATLVVVLMGLFANYRAQKANA